ncbi:MAG: glycosyltransferase [Mycobacterium sp.]
MKAEPHTRVARTLRVVVATFGTEGDIRPLIALAAGLRTAGHRVEVLAAPSGEQLAKALGLAFVPLAGDMRTVMRDEGADDFGEFMRRGGGARAMARTLARVGRDNTLAWMTTIDRSCDGADVIVFSGLCTYAALAVAELRGIARVGVTLAPLLPTDEFASPGLPARMVPRAANRLSHVLFTKLLVWGFRGPTNTARKQYGMGRQRMSWSRIPVLCAVSPTLVRQPRDWPPWARVTGDLALQTDSGWRPSPALEAFVDAGDPPIYVGMGSMGGFARDSMTKALILGVGGRRAIFAVGWSGIERESLPENFHVVGPTPHSWLFPRMAAAVHHGGAGTTHAAVRAGIPSVIVPFGADQAFWADRLNAAGIAPRSLSPRALDGAALAAAIDQATRGARDARTRRGTERQNA